MNYQEQKLVHVSAGSVELEGSLNLPSNASGIVLFARGSGSGRHSPRNQFAEFFYLPRRWTCKNLKM